MELPYGVHIKRTWLAVLIGLVLCAALSFALGQWKQEHREFAKTDVWFTGPPEDTEAGWHQLPDRLVYPVTRVYRIVASEQLKDRQWARLEHEEAERITELRIAPVEGLTPVLVRGVQLTRYNHAVTARMNQDNELWLHAETTSHWPLPMLQRPTVVLLPRFPTRLFVDATVLDIAQASR